MRIYVAEEEENQESESKQVNNEKCSDETHGDGEQHQHISHYEKCSVPRDQQLQQQTSVKLGWSESNQLTGQT